MPKKAKTFRLSEQAFEDISVLEGFGFSQVGAVETALGLLVGVRIVAKNEAIQRKVGFALPKSVEVAVKP